MKKIPEAESIWHIFPVFHAKRDAFRAKLEQNGVQSGVHYPTPVHLQPAYAHVKTPSLPESERAAREELSLPMFPELSDPEVSSVIDAVAKVARELA